MKRIYIFLAIIFVCAVSFAQDFSLSITNAEAFQTEDCILKVSLNNKSEISSMQCTMNLPDGFIINGIPVLSNRASSSHSISYNVNREGLLRIVIHSSKSENITGKDGVLFDLPLTTTHDCQLGENIISSEKVILSSSEGIQYTASPTNCSVLIKELPIKLDSQKLTVPLGSTEKMNLTFMSEYPYDKTVIWTSSKENVARVSQDGVISAVGIGSATISACVANGIHVECEVKVVEVKADSIELNKNILELIPGLSEKLTASVFPENTTNKSVTWTSSDESVAKVSTRGNVEAISLGRATISATCGEINEQCEVYVRDVVLNTTDLTIEKGQTGTIRIEKFPLNFGGVTWTSSDENIVTVESNGSVACNVHAIGLGEAYVTGSNDKCSVTCKVTVIPVLVKYVRLDRTKMSLMVNESKKLEANIFPENAENKSVIWTSSNPEVATVSDTGVVMAVNVGDAVITATAADSSGISASCDITVTPIPVREISLSQSSWEAVEGESLTLVATVLPEDATNKSVIWTSSNPEVATVNEAGIVTAVKIGDAVITVTAADGSGTKATAVIHVRPIRAESVSISGLPSGDIHIGDNFKLTATVLPENTTDKSVTWSSGNESVVSVDADGIVRALSAGETVITATTADGSNKSAQVTLSVKPNLADRIVIDPSEAEIKIGETVQLAATVYPDNTTDKKVSWSSLNPAIASVDANGLVKGLALGEAVITATAADGSGMTASATIKVLPVLAESLSIGGMPSGDIHIGDNFRLTATVLPENTTDKSVTWSSGNESVASVDADGTVRALASGEAVITATTADGSNKSAQVTVSVKPNLADRIVIDPSEAEIRIGETVQMAATVYPDNTTDKNVNWSSSNPAIASVDATGLVKGLALGEAVITATAADGSGMTASATIKVLPVLAESISIGGMPSGDIHIGDNFRLTATVLPENTTDKSVTWSSGNESVASVDADGTVRALASGEAVITATTADGSNKSAQVTVSVKPNLADRIVLDPSEAEIRIGETVQMATTVYPDNTTDKNVSWSSTNPAIASVDANGLVKGLALGEAVITATAADGSGMTASATIKVLPVLAESISIEGMPEGEITVGDKFKLTVIVYPEDTTDTSVTWSSDNENIASVDADGNVEILSEGSTVIRATANDGSDCQAQCYIDVVSGVDMLIDAGKPFRVYDINGNLLLTESVPRDLDMLTKGIYILVQGNKTYKFIR